jgi:cell division GTPase FtsZ
MAVSENISRRQLLVLGAASMAITVPLLRNRSNSNDKRKTVLGVGGAGFNLVKKMNRQGDFQATLAHTNIEEVIRSAVGTLSIPLEVPHMQPGSPIGGAIRNAAELLARSTFLALPETDRLILVAGLGGAVGSYITPAIARLAKQAGIEVMGLVYLPFSWEGDERHNARSAESLISISNVLENLHVIDMQKAMQEAPVNISINRLFDNQDDSGILVVNEYLAMK